MDAVAKSGHPLSAPNHCDPHADCKHAPGRLRERLCALRPRRRLSALTQAMCAIDPVATRSSLIHLKPPPRVLPKFAAEPCEVLNRFALQPYETNLSRSASPATN